MSARASATPPGETSASRAVKTTQPTVEKSSSSFLAARASANGLPAGAPPVPAQPKAKSSGSAPRKLTVIEGELSGTVVPLGNSPITVGRAPDSTLSLSDDYASSRHARFFPSDGQWIVEDLGSTNGTWIEKTRITGPTVLRVGAKVRIGRTTLQLQR